MYFPVCCNNRHMEQEEIQNTSYCKHGPNLLGWKMGNHILATKEKLDVMKVLEDRKKPSLVVHLSLPPEINQSNNYVLTKPKEFW